MIKLCIYINFDNSSESFQMENSDNLKFKDNEEVAYLKKLVRMMKETKQTFPPYNHLILSSINLNLLRIKMLWRVRIGHLKSQLRYSNSILSKFAPPVPYSDEKHGRYLERAKSELTEKDKAGKTPEEIIQLEKEMAIYIRNQEIQKVEIKRAQEDLGSMATITQGKGLF